MTRPTQVRTSAGHRGADGDGATRERRGTGAVPQWPSLRGMAGPDATRTLLGQPAQAGAHQQARRRLPAHAAHPRCACGAACCAVARATRPAGESNASLGTGVAGARRSQQGRGGRGEQAGATAVGDGASLHIVRSGSRQRARGRSAELKGTRRKRRFSRHGLQGNEVHGEEVGPGSKQADNCSGP